ncbi:SH3 domain-containing protein [Prosthecomicrobium sp. N25]|uniref:SH3 domain-containing protein n=1 Tax=Prosthecomicrobium sp. N25 TaxID=3129254 RepID=UPI0030787068
MRSGLFASVLAGLLLAADGGPARAAEACRVADPTGTPLNVRSAPGGEILGTIGNGRDVEILETRIDDRGRAWVLIRTPGVGAAIGWVFRDFVACRR